MSQVTNVMLTMQVSVPDMSGNLGDKGGENHEECVHCIRQK